jgi:hypothetical protein
MVAQRRDHGDTVDGAFLGPRATPLSRRARRVGVAQQKICNRAREPRGGGVARGAGCLPALKRAARSPDFLARSARAPQTPGKAGSQSSDAAAGSIPDPAWLVSRQACSWLAAPRRGKATPHRDCL